MAVCPPPGRSPRLHSDWSTAPIRRELRALRPDAPTARGGLRSPGRASTAEPLPESGPGERLLDLNTPFGEMRPAGLVQRDDRRPRERSRRRDALLGREGQMRRAA